jgi:endonuclease/exonuclease/phosphatase family metal-dependent hydrolase
VVAIAVGVIAPPSTNTASAAIPDVADTVAGAIAPATVGDTSLRVASFNIRVANASKHPRNRREKSWNVRAGAIVSQILREQIDVIGVQEASAGRIPGGSVSQFQDLANRLGEPYKLTNTESYCLVDPAGECTNGAGLSDRILYNSARLELVRQGSRALDTRSQRSGSSRHATWAEFRDLVTQKEFFFVSTHLEPGANKVGRHRSQANQILAEIAGQNPNNLPVIVVGDWASTRFSKNNTAHDVFVGAGFVDPLGNTRKQRTLAAAVAPSLINVRYSSLNNFKAKPQTLKHYAMGSYIDYIMVRGGVTPVEWETVLDLTSRGKFAGVIPSDHNMIKLTVQLT